MDEPTFGSLEDLASLPIQVQSIPIYDLPASDDDGTSIHVNFKMPGHWKQMIDEIRQKVYTKLPDVWKTESAAYRWFMLQGIMILQQIQARLDDPDAELSPDVEARLFLEQTAGKIKAKAEIITQTNDHAKTLSDAVDTLMHMGEDVEAANLINQWLSGASAQSSVFYNSFFVRVLFENPTLADNMRVLVERSHIIDDDIIDWLSEHLDTPHLMQLPRRENDAHSEDAASIGLEDSSFDMEMA